MIVGHRFRTWALLALSLTSSAAISAACSVEDHYELLSFFFDGVPTPEELAARRAAAEQPETLSPEAMTSLSNEERNALLARHVEAIQVSEHPPVKQGLCEKCHTRRPNSGAVGTQWLGDIPQLVAPPDELCFRCHEAPKGTYLHGPAASGNCIVCHQAHESLNPHLLRLAEQKELCSACHVPGETLLSEEEHEGYQDLDCVACHDPHSSERPHLLRDGWEDALEGASSPKGDG